MSFGALVAACRGRARGNPVINAVAPAPTLAYGADVVANGAFSSDTASWVAEASGGNVAALSSVAGGQAGNCLQIAGDTNSNNPRAQQAVTLAVGTFYELRFYVKQGTEASFRAYVTSTSQYGYNATLESTSSWVQYKAGVVGQAASSTVLLLQMLNPSATETLLIDTVELVPITLASALSGGGDAGAKLGLHYAKCTITDKYQAGLVACLDSAGTPANYLHAYVDRNTGKLFLNKCEAGTTTFLASGSVTYATTSRIKLLIARGVTGLSDAQVTASYGTPGSWTDLAPQTVDLSSGYGTLIRAHRTNAADAVEIEANV